VGLGHVKSVKECPFEEKGYDPRWAAKNEAQHRGRGIIRYWELLVDLCLGSSNYCDEDVIMRRNIFDYQLRMRF